MVYTAADLRFDAASHTSTLPDGRDVPHVTTVLSAVGVCTNFESIASRSRRAADAVEHGRALGAAVHIDCHAYDDGTLEWTHVHPEVLPYVEAWAELRERKRMRPILRERQVFHPDYFYTGILDGVFLVEPDGTHVLVDIKTGDPDDAAAHLQTAAYEGACRVSFPGIQINDRWAIQLQPNRAVPYRIANYTDYVRRPDAYQDYAKWLACLTTFNEQPAQRRRKVA